MTKRLRNIHPGEILLEEFMKPMRLSCSRLSREILYSEGEIIYLIQGRSDVSNAMAGALADRFGTTPEFWINLQKRYDEEENEK